MTGLKKSQWAIRWFTITMAAILLVGALSPAFSSPAQASPAAAVCVASHIVKPNETLTSIAKKYGVTVEALAAANNLTTTSKVYKGKALCIPANKKVEAQAILNVAASKGMVTISGTGLAKTKAYLIKVREGDLGIWYPLGRVSTTKDGTLLARTLPLPKQLKSRMYLTVCLKNQTSDALTCKKIFHIP